VEIELEIGRLAPRQAAADVELGTLPALGYEPVVVPKGTIEERAAFVLARAT